jgi:tetratricopeptide (TPR) repeat protein
MWRSVVAIAIALAALAALDLLVVVPWRCDVLARGVSESTERAKLLRGSERSRAAATNNISLLGECAELCRTDVNMAMLLASNFRLLNHNSVAAALLEEALHYEHRPELYFELGNTQLELGLRDEALENFVRAGNFVGTSDFKEIADPEIRERAYAAVSRHEEELLARQGRR